MKASSYHRALFIFRRDLRLEDNTGLIAALTKADSVIPCFIFDPQQITSRNKFRSLNAVQFMIESLLDLKKQLVQRKGKLFIFYGSPDVIIKKLLHRYDIDLVCMNRDYTAYSKRRDQRISKVCAARKVACEFYDDVLLHAPGVVTKKDKKPYTIFTPFFKRAVRIKIDKPQPLPVGKFSTKKIEDERAVLLTKLMPVENKNIFVRGGRAESLKILNNLEKFVHYARERDIPALEKTTGLSAYLKFGTCSIREVYVAMVKALGPHHHLVRQLYWRDFFTHIAFYFPHVFGAPFYRKYQSILWQNDKKKFAAWCEGRTGFPLVDAGMRQLNATGFMHNRVRMVVASFLVKDLHIDWRWGERYFATQLVDYDPSVNNGNWQWAASTGCDAQPYFRIFNPWLQQKKFDRECVYIKRWIPELKPFEPKIIHTWYKQAKTAKSAYPAPLIEHEQEARYAKTAYLKAICKAKELSVD